MPTHREPWRREGCHPRWRRFPMWRSALRRISPSGKPLTTPNSKRLLHFKQHDITCVFERAHALVARQRHPHSRREDGLSSAVQFDGLAELPQPDLATGRVPVGAEAPSPSSSAAGCALSQLGSRCLARGGCLLRYLPLRHLSAQAASGLASQEWGFSGPRRA